MTYAEQIARYGCRLEPHEIELALAGKLPTLREVAAEAARVKAEGLRTTRDDWEPEYPGQQRRQFQEPRLDRWAQ